MFVLTSGTIGPNEGHTGLQINAKVNTAVQLVASGIGKAYILNRKNGNWELTSIGKRPIPFRINIGLLSQTGLELLLEQLLSGLGLPHHLHGTVTETGNEILDFGNIPLLRLVLSHLDHVLILAKLHVHIVVSAVVPQLLVGHIQPDDMGTYIVHEVLGVTYEEQNLVPVGKVILKPKNGIHICEWVVMTWKSELFECPDYRKKLSYTQQTLLRDK